MLKIDHLSTSYKTIDGDIHVINDLDFEIYDNEIFGIAGESGCGKTTLLKTLYDIVEFPLVIDQGKVILSGEKNGQPFSYESGEIRKTWVEQHFLRAPGRAERAEPHRPSEEAVHRLHPRRGPEERD